MTLSSSTKGVSTEVGCTDISSVPICTISACSRMEPSCICGNTSTVILPPDFSSISFLNVWAPTSSGLPMG